MRGEYEYLFEGFGLVIGPMTGGSRSSTRSDS